MKYCYSFALWVILCIAAPGSYSWAQLSTYSAFGIPDDLKANADEVYRVDYMAIDIEDEKTSTIKVKKVVTLLNSNSTEHFQAVAYNRKFTKIVKLSARIYDALGQEVRKLKAKDFTDRSVIASYSVYEDSRMKIAELRHNRYPYTIEFEYEIIQKKIPFYPASALGGYRTSVEQFDYIVRTKKDFEIKYKAYNTTLQPKINQQDYSTVYHWSTQNIPALVYESYAPYSDQIRPVIKISPLKFQFENYKGNLSSWKDFGQFMYDLNKDRDQLSPEMKQKVKSLINEAQSDQEKIAILYRYLQDNMRYVSVQLGIGGWQTFDAKYVEENKYGDCKALSNFMKAMLKEAGIKSYAALIHASDDSKIDISDDFAFPGFANHVILNIPSEEIWLECTSSDYPPNYIGEHNQDRPTLLITEEGGVIKHTPLFDLDLHQEKHEALIQIDDKGAANIKLQSIFSGPKHEVLRYYSNNQSPQELEEYFLSTLDLPAFSIDQLQINNDAKTPQSTLDFAATVKRYSSKAGKRIFLPLNKLNAFTEVPKVIEKRTLPIHIKEQYREEDIYTFELPQGYEVESLPQKNIDLESEFGHYKVDIQMENGRITYHRQLEIYTVKLPADRYNDLRNFYKEIANADGMKVVLVQKKT